MRLRLNEQCTIKMILITKRNVQAQNPVVIVIQ